MYYNFHAMAKRLINEGHCISVSIFSRYKHIYPAMVIYFDNHKPMPIRKYMWKQYQPLLQAKNINILNEENISLDED